jgi:hypothetical protein
MWTLLFGFVTGILQLNPDGLPAAPFDLAVGQQTVQLREPLVARDTGVRMVLFVRAAGRRDIADAVPAGSVTAHLIGSDGRELVLEHTGYYHWRGYTGLVLTETERATPGGFFRALELEARVPLQDVRLVWLDRLARDVRDVRPVL